MQDQGSDSALRAESVHTQLFLEVFIDECNVTRSKPAFFVGYKHEWGVIVRVSLNYYMTYDLALKALKKKSYIKLTDPIKMALSKLPTTTPGRPETMRARI